jgi:hypothetical protein
VKIKNVAVEGSPEDLTPWTAWSQPLPDVASHKYADSYVVLRSSLCVALTTSGDRFRFCFDPGYLFDHASIPRIFRGIIDHDSDWVRLAAYCHDACFHHKTVDVDTAADIFYGVMRYEISKIKSKWYQFGIPKARRVWRARVMRRAVKGRIAEKLFEDSSEIDKYNTGRCSIRRDK